MMAKIDITREHALEMLKNTTLLPYRDNWELEQVYRLTGSKTTKKLLDKKCPGWANPQNQ